MKKYLKRLMIAIITVLSIGIATNNVKADTRGFAYRAFRDTSGNVRWRLNTGHSSINAGKFTSPDGTIAFCIEPALSALLLPDGNYDINYNYSEFSSITGLSFDKIRELSLISYYGYGFNGDISDENYIATQLEIWQAVSPNCCSIESGYSSLVNSKRDIIRRYVNNEITKPSFHNITEDIQLNQNNYFEDANGVLSGYEVTGCTNCNASIEGNTLIVNSNKIGNAKVSLKRVIGNSNQADILYTSGSYQKLMTFRQPDPIISGLNLNVKGGVLKIQKNDKDNKTNIPSGEATLEGAIYEVYNYDKMKVAEVTTDANGYAQIELPFGKYTLKEVKAPIGYTVDNNVYSFNFDNNNLESIIKIDEKVIDAYGLVVKEYGDDEIGYKYEENAKFNIIDYKNEVVGTISTDDEGIGTIKLPYGTYTLHQVSGMENYKFVDDVVFEINEANKTYKFRLKNISFPRLDITKVDSNSNETIKGAQIDIYKFNEETDEFELFYEGITDNSGKIHLDNLKLGKYYYMETKSPIGYLLDENKYYFEIDEYGKTYKMSLKNQKITGKLEFSKVDFSTSEPLPNTLIEIYNEKDELVYSGRTDENGKIVIEELEYGKYYILEKEAPEGYQLNPDKMWLEITEDGQVIKSEMKDEKIVVSVPDTRMEDFVNVYLICLITVGSGAIIYGMYRIKSCKKKNK